jgi:ABC-2 type transport system ATP-binding protein
MSIEVKNLTKIFGEQKAVNNISFKIETGQVVGFLGPNGAGKSTTMKMITGYITPTEGKLQVCGVDVLEKPLQTKQMIGYLPEHNPLYLEMYVTEYLNFAANVYGISNVKKAVEDVIIKTGLTPERKKKISQLSKGYRQRVGLAQALINNPQVLILDEPTSGLDPNQVIEIRNIIKELGKNHTVMLSTHIMQEVEAMCDRVLIINKGKIITDEKTSNLSNILGEGNSYFVKFKSSVEDKKLKQFTQWENFKPLGDNSYRLELSVEKDISQILFEFSRDFNIPIIEQRKEVNNLEQIFQKLTKNA